MLAQCMGVREINETKQEYQWWAIGPHRDRVSASARWGLRRDVAVALIQAAGVCEKVQSHKERLAMS